MVDRDAGIGDPLLGDSVIGQADAEDFAGTFSVAGIGPVSIMFGSLPATAALWIPAVGRNPRFWARSVVMSSRAAEPSLI